MLAGIERLAAHGKPVPLEMRAAFERQTGRTLPSVVPDPLPVPSYPVNEQGTAAPNTAQPSPRSRVTRAPKTKASRFVRLDNTLLQDGRLSYRARGLLAFVLSLPSDWEHAADRLADASNEGEKAVVSALHELEKFGYSWLEKNQGAGGKFRNRRYFSETPNPEKRRSEQPTPTPEKGGSADSANRPTLNRPSVDRPAGEGGVYETTVDETTIQSIPPAPPSGGVGELFPSDSVPPKLARNGESVRPRNPLFDALAVATDGDPFQLTADTSRAVGVALSKIQKVTPSLTADEIKRRAANYRDHFRDAALTAPALAKHWARCDQSKNGASGSAGTDWSLNPLYR